MIKTILRSRHLTLTVGIIAMTMMVASFVDFQFKTVSFESFSTKAELTAFLGKFYGRLSLVSLALQALFAYRFIKWLGVSGVIMLLPLGLLAGSAAMLIYPGLIAAVLLRGADGSLKYSIDKTGRELLFLPVSLDVKKRTKMFIDMFVDRWFRGLAGALLLLCTVVLELSIRQISMVVIGLLAIWLTLVLMMRKEYVNSFRKAIEKRQIDLGEIRTHIQDTSTVNALIMSLGSDNERQVVYALGMLESVKDVELIHPIRPLLDARSAEVREKALRALHIHGDASLLDKAHDLLNDENPEVRCQAVQFICEKTEGDRAETLRQLLAHENARICYAAIACVARGSDDSEMRLVTRDLIDTVLADQSNHAEEGRVQLARLLGGVSDPELRPILEKLLHDSSSRVASEAMTSVGRLGERHYVPWLLDKLGDRRTRSQARASLALFGGAIMGSLADYLVDKNVRITIRRHIPRVVASIPEQKSVDMLVSCYSQVDSTLKFFVLKGLNRLRTKHAGLKFSARKLDPMLMDETRDYYEAFQALQLQEGAADSPADALLRKALEEKLDRNLERVFRLLGLIYPPKDIFSAYQGITSGRRGLRANAVEFLDSLLKSDVKRYVAPIIEDISAEEVLSKGEELFQVAIESREEALLSLIQGNDLWLRCCALYVTAGADSERLSQAAAAAVNDANPVVAETARLATKGS